MSLYCSFVAAATYSRRLGGNQSEIFCSSFLETMTCNWFSCFIYFVFLFNFFFPIYSTLTTSTIRSVVIFFIFVMHPFSHVSITYHAFIYRTGGQIIYRSSWRILFLGTQSVRDLNLLRLVLLRGKEKNQANKKEAGRIMEHQILKH